MSTWGRCEDCGEETFRGLHQADLTRRRQRLNEAFDKLPKRLRKRAERAGALAYPVGTLSIREGDVITKAIGALGPEFKRLERRAEAAERERDEALAQVARVREVHRRRERNAMDFVHFGFGQTEFPDWCDHCRRNWPCGTIAALDGRETT